MPAVPDYAEVARDTRIIEWLRQCLSGHARVNTASSRCVRRALVLPVAPSPERGEITDKGSINQRAILRHHVDRLVDLYRAVPPPHVAVVDVEESQS